MSIKTTWIKTKHPGVRYREHPTRKHGIRADRYYTIRYKINKKDKEEGLGWESQGWTAEKANERLSELKQAQRLGEGPQTLNEKREIEEARRKVEQEEQERQAKEAITFAQIFTESYLPQAKANKKLRSCYVENGLFKVWIEPVIGALPMKDVSPFHLERLKKNMADAGRAARSIHYTLAVIRQVFNFARNHSLFMGDNPVSKVKKPTADNQRTRFLSHDEANQLLNALAAKSTEVYEMALLSFHCGLRAGEIFNLTWGDVDIDREILALRDTKNKKGRPAFMTPSVKAMFQAKDRDAHSDLVWPGRTGVRSQISKTFDRVVKELGLNKGITDPRQKLVFHSLRHTNASWLIESGSDIYTVKKLLGHQTIAMTERYSHLGENILQNAVKRLGESMEETRKGEVIELTKA